MKLSIIIPVYNEKDFVRRCLDSVYSNDDVEVIVVDDGSDDGSSEIIAEYADRFKVIRKTKTPFGVSWARNVGMNEAQGDYITFLDSDDEMSEGGIGSMLSVVGMGFDVVQFNHWRQENEMKAARFFNNAGWYAKNNLPQKWVLVWNKIYRREFLIENAIYFPWNIRFEEDCIFNLRCLAHTDKIVHYSAATVIKHNDNKNSICHTVTREDIFGITSELTALLKEGQEPELERIIRHRIGQHWESKNAKRLFGGGQ